MKRLLKRVYGESKNKKDLQNIPSFDMEHYKDITDARLKHLKSLNLPVADKTVIDVGCGVGRLSEFFADKGCDIFCVDGREENIQTLQKLYPGRKSAVVDLENSEIMKFGKFDVVFCYGLLYHLSDPFGFLKNAFKICKEMMIIETCIMDAQDPVLRLVQEPQDDVTQAVSGFGCRPSPSYVIACLKLAGFKYVYTPVDLPDHKQFKYRLVNDFSHLKKKAVFRGIFIGSSQEMQNDRLRQCK